MESREPTGVEKRASLKVARTLVKLSRVVGGVRGVS